MATSSWRTKRDQHQRHASIEDGGEPREDGQGRQTLTCLNLADKHGRQLGQFSEALLR